MAPKLDPSWTLKFMRRKPRDRTSSTPVMISNRQDLRGMGEGTSSDPVRLPVGKRVRGDSRTDAIYVDDVEGLGLEGAGTIYARRSGGRPMINPVNTHNLPDDYYHNHELGALDRADHRDYPNPHNYTVRTIYKEDFDKSGC
jgi:hypothetical protein